ncbi:leukocyte surface antigen CD53-like [Leptopilina heterotoma]|uniref:leukocyte surface antigen CD53-like n=1 Tax=Leptopilina heterotoma TaxID=63436 RepID=UPI001CA8D0EA|nr:leukocyte surface antigen CD53-like [Leptopilina heterotoma]
MARHDNEEESDEESEDSEDDDDDDEDEITESGTSVSRKKSKILGVSIDKFSYKRIPRNCLKTSFIAINSLIFLTGIATFVLSVWMMMDMKLFIGQKIYMSILLMVAIFGSVVSFLGLFAFVKKRKGILMVYIVLYVIALCMIFISAIMSFTFFDNLVKRIRDDMRNSIEKYSYLDWATETWDNTQRYLQCCGIKSYKDWLEQEKQIPRSCCAVKMEECIKMTEEVAYQSGCLKSAVLLIKSHINKVSLMTLFISKTLVS